MSCRDRICNLLSSCLAGKDWPPWKGWFIRIDMRGQLHCQNPCCIFERGWPPCFSPGTLLFPPSALSPRSTETKCRTGANSSSRKKGLTKSGSLTNTNLINTNLIYNRKIEKNCLFCILSPVPLLPRALRNRSDYIDIPSTQYRSSKGSRRPTKVRKPGSFRKRIPIQRVHNRMDKLTLTRQFGIQIRDFLGRYREGIGMEEYRFIQKKRFSIDSNTVPMG